MNSIAVPRRMRHLPLDPRDYPIPFNVYRDQHGRPHFTVQDTATVYRCVMGRLCAICGERLEPARMWFVGGPFSAFHPQGSYYDPPMHAECARYALRVCPYLALASYREGRIPGRTVPDDDPVGLVDMTMMPDRPPVFVAGMARDLQFDPDSSTIFPARPFVRLEFWQHGRRLPDADGRAIAEQYRLARQLGPTDTALPRIIRAPKG